MSICVPSHLYRHSERHAMASQVYTASANVGAGKASPERIAAVSIMTKARVDPEAGRL